MTKTQDLTQNSIMVIEPYIWKRMWVFDDEATGLKREPFVSGADILCDYILDQVTQHMVDKEAELVNSFTAIFSATHFPSAKIKLALVKTEDEGNGGTDYYWKERKLNVWLCPALLKYFPTPPGNIYIDYK